MSKIKFQRRLREVEKRFDRQHEVEEGLQEWYDNLPREEQFKMDCLWYYFSRFAVARSGDETWKEISDEDGLVQFAEELGYTIETIKAQIPNYLESASPECEIKIFYDADGKKVYDKGIPFLY